MRALMSALFLIVTMFTTLPAMAQSDEPSPGRAPAQAGGAKSMNFRFSPISALVGIVDANFDFVLGPNLTLGPKLTYMNFKLFDVQLKGTALGAEGRYHFSGVMTDGGYANVQLSAINIEASAKSSTTGETATASGSAIIGFGTALT